MKQNLTELVFILDRSGSMSGLEKDTIGGYNGLLEKQRGEPGEALITTVLFDDRLELLHERVDIRAVADLAEKDYFVRGMTALWDAVGSTIWRIHNAQLRTDAAERPEKTLVVITTDGEENASREYMADQVRALVDRMKAAYGWEFIFLGANIDAVATAKRIGIAPDRTANYRADSVGTAVNFRAVSAVASRLRSGKAIEDDWKMDIDKDYRQRR